jgi:hypothetical protein
MAAGDHRPLKVISLYANGIWRQRYNISKHLHDLHLDVGLLSETHLKPHDRFFIPNCNFYRNDNFPRRKEELPLQLGKAFSVTM